VSLVYPARGQSPQQLERDRYECHLWAVEQSGYDPSRQLPMDRVDVQPGTPPGAGLAIGAIAGAIFGAAVAGPRSTGTGALLGGVAGAAIGASSDANAKTSAAAEQSRSDAYYARDQAAIASYQRANGVCLEGRGYTVG